MEQVDVVAVVGSCAPERQRFAKRMASDTQRMFVPAQRLAASPDPATEAAVLAPWAQGAGVVCEFPGRTPMTELIGTLAHHDARTTLSGVVCVADAAHLLDDLVRDTYAAQPSRGPGGGVRHTAHAMLTVTQLEYASMIVLVNWEAVPTDDLAAIMALVSALSPRARLRLDHAGGGSWHPDPAYTVGQERPGWVCVLNGDHRPHMTDAGVSAFRYENIRPLHPARLHHVLDERIEPGEFGTVIRSAGFCRFATRPRIVGRWDHVGRMISFDPLGTDDAVEEGEELLALGQELAVIGLDLDRRGLTAALDEAVLTDAELAQGPDAWAAFDDPFPAWPTVADRAE